MDNLEEKLSTNAKKAMAEAARISTRHGCSYIGSEHILYGLLNTPDGVAKTILNDAGVDVKRYEYRLRACADKTSNIMGLTPRAKNMLQHAMEYAVQSGTSFTIGTEHLLLAILSVEESLAVRILDEFHIDIGRMIDRLEEKISVEYGDYEEEFERAPKKPKSAEAMKTLAEYGVDMTERARMGKQNPPAVGENAYLVVRPENLHLQAGSESFNVQIVNRLFEGDRIDYHVQIPNSNQTKPYSMSVPFLPGTGLIDVGTELKATFTPDAGVIIKR